MKLKFKTYFILKSLPRIGNVKALKIAKELHYQLYDLYDPLYSDGNPAGIKAALKILGICNDTVRLPLVNVSDKTYQKLKRIIKS